jgi:hypothetical protein
MRANVAVVGSGRDFSLQFDNGSELGVHTPAMSDLSVLSGRNVTLRAPQPAYGSAFSARALLVYDEEGLVYVANNGAADADGALSESFHASAFAQPATEGQSEGSDGFINTAIRFTTDDGDVDLGPGEIRGLRIGGALWRTVVVGSGYSARGPECGAETIWSFEMLRLPRNTACPGGQVHRPASERPVEPRSACVR